MLRRFKVSLYAEGVGPDSSIYDREYFLSDYCEGFGHFRDGHGVSPLKARLVELLEPGPGVRVLDAGCGRGEVLLAAARRGASVAGIDYAEAAVELSRETLAEVAGADIRHGELTGLPWEQASFDRALLGDVIEHLDPEQAPVALAELRRVLRPGGRLIVHTAPNRLFLSLGWPLARIAMRIAGRRQAASRTDAWIAESKRYHVNEQSLFSLRRALRGAGFTEVRTWIDPDVLRGGEHHLSADAVGESRLLRLAAPIASRRPFRTVFGNDLYATGRKP